MYSYSNKRLLEIELKVNLKIIEIKRSTIEKIKQINNHSHNELLIPIIEFEIQSVEKQNSRIYKEMEVLIKWQKKKKHYNIF